MPPLRRPEVWVFAILLASYAYFWQSRDWNSASRLMLTYALVDRGTVELNGLEDQTHDRAFLRGRYYSDKPPGFSLLATVPYAAAKLALGLPQHPLNVRGFAHWPADYWVTLGTSGLFTALSGAILAGLARVLGCSPRRAALVGLSYGLATPAYVYATVSYGHQVTAFALLASFALLERRGGRRPGLEAGAAGFLAAFAAVVELPAGLVSAVLGFSLLAQVSQGRRRLSALGEFAVGALGPTLVLLGYNLLAFGAPGDMGYFHHTTKIFSDVHSEKNPLGLVGPDLTRVGPLLWGRYRGLLFYAPVVAVVPVGLVVLGRAKRLGMAVVTVASLAAVFLVNLSYPEWTGGWSTGPRLLVTLLPFAMLPAAAWLGQGGRTSAWTVALLSLCGGVLMLLFVGVGGRVPQFYPDPLFDPVWPLWQGRAVAGWVGEPLARNLFAWFAPGWLARLPVGCRWVQFAPLVAGQALAVLAMIRVLGPPPETVKPAC
jgi:hypothetical protein